MDFFARIDALEQLVGEGAISAILAVDGGERTEPLEHGYWQNFLGTEGFKKIENYNNGGPHAAQRALQETFAENLEDVSATLLTEGTEAGMKRSAGRMQERFRENAPKRTGQYSESTAGFVVDNDVVVHEERGEHYGEDPGAA